MDYLLLHLLFPFELLVLPQECMHLLALWINISYYGPISAYTILIAEVNRIAVIVPTTMTDVVLS
jgi:hypothetical protein